MPVSPREIQICERVCRVASQLGIKIKEHDTRFGHCFTWRLADGREVYGSTQEDRQNALFDACQKLLPQILNHV